MRYLVIKNGDDFINSHRKNERIPNIVNLGLFWF